MQIQNPKLERATEIKAKNYGYLPPSDWRDAVIHGQSWDAIKVGREMELSSLQVSASLQGRELWDKFGDLETEMLITKTGRRMFPSCKVTVTGLNPQANYVLMMDMVPFDDNKYKWTKDRWEVSGRTEPRLPNRFFIHPDSPSSGERWMQYPVSFHKLKLTNDTLNSNGLVILHSMHKYQPRLHIIQSPKAFTPGSGGYQRFSFPEAAFIAVTAYQNPEITKLKIDNNPFAKGFRDSGLNRKRFREQKMSCCREEPEKIPLTPPYDHQNPPHSQHDELDFLLPLPPKVSRMQLPESTLRSLETSPLCSPRSPQPLTDILNRIHSRMAPGNLLQAQYDRTFL
ncbi:T-box transcription factor TBX6L [Aplochiton taeniatus]